MIGRHCCTYVVLGALLLAGPAQAQSINYDRLERIFGEPVTISATGIPQRASDVPATMEIITAEQIQRSGATTIPGILRQLAGVSVMQSSPNGFDVFVRGYTLPMAGRLLVLVDGRQIYNDSFGYISWTLLPVELDEIRQIEVVKGPQSALYGFNAAAGVINIITFNPLDRPTNSARVSVGTGGNLEGSAIVTSKLGDHTAFHAAVGGYIMNESGLHLDNDTQPLLPSTWHDPDRRSLHFDLSTRFDDNSRLNLTASYVDGFERRSDWEYLPVLLNQQVESIKLDYSVDTRIGQLSSKVYYNKFHTDMVDTAMVTSPMDNSALVASINDLFKVNATNSVRLSLEFRRNDSSIYASPDAHIGYDVWSGSAMWESQLDDTLTLVNAIREDWLQLGRSGSINPVEGFTNADFNRNLSATSFNSALVWRAGKEDTFRLSEARGFNLPTLGQFGAWDIPTKAGTWFGIYGTPSLKPTAVWNTELSWDHQFPEQTASTRLSAFYQTNENIILQNPGPSSGDGYYTNVGNSRTFGIEAAINKKIASNWNFNINYTYQMIVDKLPSDDYWPQYVYASQTPNHMINAGVSYTNDPWEVDLHLNYMSRYRLPDINVSDPLYDSGQKPAYWFASSTFGNTFILTPRVAYHLTDSVTAQVTAQGLWARHEMPLQTAVPLVMASVIVRW